MKPDMKLKIIKLDFLKYSVASDEYLFMSSE